MDVPNEDRALMAWQQLWSRDTSAALRQQQREEKSRSWHHRAVTGRRLLAETLKGQESQSHLCRWKDNLWLKSSRGRIETPARAGAGKWWLLVRKRMFLLTRVWLESWDLEAGMGTAGEAPKVIAPDSGDRASASGRKSKVWWRLSVKKISALGHIFWSNWALNL